MALSGSSEVPVGVRRSCPDVPTFSIRLSGSDDDSSDDEEGGEERGSLARTTSAPESTDVVSEAEEAWGSCTTLYSEYGDTPSCSELSTQPSEAELAYAPVWYTPHIQTEASASQSSTNQPPPYIQYDHQGAPAVNQDGAYSEKSVTDVSMVTDAPDANADADAGGYAFPNVQYVQQGYATDAEGNTYSVHYVTADPACDLCPGQIPEAGAVGSEVSESGPSESWVDMCQSPRDTTSPSQPSYQPTRGFTDNYEVNYSPVFTFTGQVGEQPMGHHPQLVCAGEAGYQELKSTADNMTYPVLYVSCAGLLTLLMRDGVALEMTLDQTLRVVSEWPRMAAGISARGSEACVFLHDIKLYQEGTKTEVSIYNNRRALMTTDNVYFSTGALTYRMSGPDLFVTEKPVFNDLVNDLSLSVLSSSKSYGQALIPMYAEIAKSAKYVYHNNGGVTVHINGVRVYQNPRGDVDVSIGVKFMKISPKTGNIFLETNWVEMALERRSVVKVKRGGHRIFASRFDFEVASNGMVAGMDRSHHVFIRPQNVRHVPLNPNRYLGDPTLPRIRRRSRVRTHWRSRPFTVGQSQDEQTCTCCDGSTLESRSCKPTKVQHAEFEEGETRL